MKRLCSGPGQAKFYPISAVYLKDEVVAARSSRFSEGRKNSCERLREFSTRTMLRTGVAGLLLTCMACFGCCQAETGVVVNVLQAEDCQYPSQPFTGSVCKISGLFDDDFHWCVELETMVCGADRFVAEGSTCTYKIDNTIFTCRHGKWTTEGQIPEFHRQKRFLLFAAWAVVLSCIIFCRGTGTAHVRNRPPQFQDCPQETLTFPAQAGNTSGNVTWDIPRASDPENKRVSVEHVSGPEPGDLFTGQSQVIYKARDDGGATSYCRFHVDVKVTRCSPDPLHILHGTASCNTEENNIFGSVCNYTCDVGHEIQSQSSEIECQSDGSWSSDVPECTPVSCGEVNVLGNGKYECPDGYVFPKACFVNCNPGYQQQSGPPFITCSANGTWTSTESCSDVQAPSFPDGCPNNIRMYSGPLGSPMTVTWTDPDVIDNSGLAVTLTSDVAKGSELDPGFRVIRITATDVSGNSASCNFDVSVEVRNCLPLSTPANSAVNCTRGYIEGSECTVSCQSGYALQGSATLTCLENEQWDNSEPTCEGVQCPVNPSIENGQFDCRDGFQYPSVCILSCDNTFERRSLANIHCQENGSWSMPGECYDNYPPTFPNGCPPNIEEYASRLGETTAVSWAPPVVEDNSGLNVTLQSTHESGSLFPAGVTKVTYTATDHLANAQICHFTVTVITLLCGAPSFGQYMVYTCDDGYVHGASCTLGCTNSFPLSGAGSITCERQLGIFPPEMVWRWDPVSGQPECIETSCSNLTAPQNGALTCFQGNFAKDCYMSCQEEFDVPRTTDGRFTCPNNKGIWYPTSEVQDCTARYVPGNRRLGMSIYYYPDTCQESLDSLKANFLERLGTSLVLASCGNTTACLINNLEVTCGPVTGRKKRDTAYRLRTRRQVQVYYLKFSFDLVMNYTQSSRSPEEIYQETVNISVTALAALEAEANSGHFNLGNLTVDETGVGYPTLSADCPPGTLFVNTHTTTVFSCAGCSKGHYLAENSEQCQQCPMGQYTDLDNATVCTPCPEGWSTLTTASTNSSQCRELCTAGHYSHDGFVPCQPCPPGRYQPEDRGTACRPCPASTWTSGAATSLDQCVHADAVLRNNTGLTATVSTPLSSLRLTAYMYLDHDSAVTVNFTFSSTSDGFSVYLYTHSDAIFFSPSNSETASVHTEARNWSRLEFTVSPSDGRSEITHNNVSILANSFPSMTTVPATNMSIVASEGQAIVSGLYADAPGQDQQNTTDNSNRSCNGQVSANQLMWSVPATAVQTPSICDAVDECLSSPCSAGHGVCENLLGGFLCHCQDGWSGDTCHVAPDTCYQHQCQNGATCQPGVNSYTCVCDQQHAGTLCQLTRVHGGFSEWSVWSNCSASCEGQQQRQRQCNMPSPSNGGRNCSGPYSQTQSCGQTHCPVDGLWGSWAPWSACSVTCGSGERGRHRDCNNPAPLHGGDQCDGLPHETEACTVVPCPVDGGWRDWSGWTPCSATCDNGFTTRERACDNPVPENGGRVCAGNERETKICSQPKCPVCSELKRRNSKSTVLECEVDLSPYVKKCNLTCAIGYVSTEIFPQYVCGDKTGHLWNTQMQPNTTMMLPDCTKPKTPSKAHFSLLVPMERDCSNSNDIIQGVEINLSVLPCAQSANCSTRVSTQCEQPQLPSSAVSRKNGSTSESLAVTFDMTLDFGDSVVLDSNDTVQQYVQLLKMGEESAQMVAQNDTEELFSVIVGGTVVRPDLSSISYNASLGCQPGTVVTSAFCVACPEGSREVEGQCELCPLGQYQDQPASTYCKPCPPGLSWDLAGAADISHCIFPHNVTFIDDNKPVGYDVTTIIIAVCASVCAYLAVGVAIAVFCVKHRTWVYKVTSRRRRPPQDRPQSTTQSRPSSAAVINEREIQLDTFPSHLNVKTC